MFNSKNPLVRKRKNYFDLSFSQQKKNKKLIKDEAMKSLNDLCKSMGLRLNEIKISPDDEPSKEILPKISLAENNFSNDYKAFVWMKIKDSTNMSRKKYKIMRKLLIKNYMEKIPGHKRVYKIQNNLNKLFVLQSNNFGFFVDPGLKIKFVISKFLLKNYDFLQNSNTKQFKIKLSADSVTISRKNIKLLNFTFSLMDDYENCKSVFGHYILGSILD